MPAELMHTFIYRKEGIVQAKDIKIGKTYPIPLVPPVTRAVIPLRDHLPSPELHPDV